jgi:YgiT-type zinc finger domain-containing protein
MAKQANKVDFLVCDVCGKEGALIHHVTRSYGKGARLLVIENVPLVSCPHCGESYMTAATLHQIERIKRQRSRSASKRPVAVAVFA